MKCTVLLQADAKKNVGFPWPPHEAAQSIFDVSFFDKNSVFLIVSNIQMDCHHCRIISFLKMYIFINSCRSSVGHDIADLSRVTRHLCLSLFVSLTYFFTSCTACQNTGVSYGVVPLFRGGCPLCYCNKRKRDSVIQSTRNCCAALTVHLYGNTILCSLTCITGSIACREQIANL